MRVKIIVQTCRKNKYSIVDINLACKSSNKIAIKYLKNILHAAAYFGANIVFAQQDICVNYRTGIYVFIQSITLQVMN